MAPPSKPNDKESQERPNTLGWGDRDLSVILDALESRSKEQAPHVKRDYSRWPFRKTTIPTRIWHPGGSLVSLRLACRNISRGGISLLHNAFVHPGTKIAVTLNNSMGNQREIAGKVRRCVHIRGPLHEIGVAFDAPVDLRDYLEVAKTPDFFSLEKVDPATLQGRILYLDDSDLDIRIIQHYFRETSIQLKATTKPQEALQLAQEGVDLILTDWMIPEMNGTDFVAELRGQRIDTPAIILTGDPMGLMQQGFASLSNVTLLSKPVQQLQLLRAVAEQFLIQKEVKERPAVQRDAGAIDPKFVGVVEGYAEKILAELEKADFTTAMSLCSNLRTNAMSLGALTIAESCAGAANSIAVKDNAEVIRRRLREVVAACKRAVNATKAA